MKKFLHLGILLLFACVARAQESSNPVLRDQLPAEILIIEGLGLDETASQQFNDQCFLEPQLVDFILNDDLPHLTTHAHNSIKQVNPDALPNLKPFTAVGLFEIINALKKSLTEEIGNLSQPIQDQYQQAHPDGPSSLNPDSTALPDLAPKNHQTSPTQQHFFNVVPLTTTFRPIKTKSYPLNATLRDPI